MTPFDSSKYKNLTEPDPQHSNPPVSTHERDPDSPASANEEDSSTQGSFAHNYPPRSQGKKKRKISLSRDYIFVLWGPQFDEVAATIFITQLREAGLRVKVVSPVRQKMPGEYGVALFADYTIERALRYASQAITVIIPCGLKAAKTLQDSRFFDLFEQAHLNHAKFFMSNMPEAELDQLNLFPSSMGPDDFIIYPEHSHLINFVRQIPHWLPYVLM